jgi:hypothetical protein
MKKIFAISLLACISLSAHAGFWDSLFGGGKKAAPAPAPVVQSAPAPTPAKSSSRVETGLQLLPLLTQSLGVSGEQATGGMGSLLQAAQILMANNEFSAIAEAVPGTESLMKAAPVVKEVIAGGGMMNNAMSMASKYSPEAKAGTELVSQFRTLGMGPEMIPKFADVGSDYLNKTGNPELGMLLKSVIPGAQ